MPKTKSAEMWTTGLSQCLEAEVKGATEGHRMKGGVWTSFQGSERSEGSWASDASPLGAEGNLPANQYLLRFVFLLPGGGGGVQRSSQLCN